MIYKIRQYHILSFRSVGVTFQANVTLTEHLGNCVMQVDGTI